MHVGRVGGSRGKGVRIEGEEEKSKKMVRGDWISFLYGSIFGLKDT